MNYITDTKGKITGKKVIFYFAATQITQESIMIKKTQNKVSHIWDMTKSRRKTNVPK